jgi:integrase
LIKSYSGNNAQYFKTEFTVSLTKGLHLVTDITSTSKALVVITDAFPQMAVIGQVANTYASKSAFSDYQEKLSKNTLRRHLSDLMVFVQFLAAAGMPIDISTRDKLKEKADLLMHDATAWDGITYGLVDGFVKWQLREKYSIGSVNVRLSTVKSYCGMAVKAQILNAQEYAMIKLVTGYKHKEGRNIDVKRGEGNIRKGTKKENPVFLTKEQVHQLKQQPNTPQGHRDALLVCLLVDHGLRCGEIAGLTLNAFDLVEGTLTFYREKVDKTQNHKLTDNTRTALMRYLQDCTPGEYLLVGSSKGGLMSGGMSARAITKRFNYLCKALGITTASAHDGRHTWATRAIKAGTDIKSLQDAGGWSSPAMPLRYAESSKVANEGVKLD